MIAFVGHRLTLSLAAGLVFAAAASTALAQTGEPNKLTVATWGGAYGQSQGEAFFEPFAKETGIRIEAITYDGSLAVLRRRLSEAVSPWDVIDASPAAVAALCEEGLLEKIDPSILIAGEDGQRAADDFLAGGLQPCGIGSVAWSAVVAFDRRAFKTAPSKIADLLDLQKLPGKRALPRGPRYTLEFALMADGVPADAVYRELETEAGVERAFTALDKIKPQIVWWDHAKKPVLWLGEQKAAMAIAFNGRIFGAVAAGGDHVGVVWDGQIYELDQWAIPSKAANKADARRFIAYATTPERLAEQARWIAYGPVRKSAVALVGRHATVDIDMAPYLPTAPENLGNALQFDEGWWTKHGPALTRRFEEWAGPEIVEAAPPKEETEREAPPAPVSDPNAEAAPVDDPNAVAAPPPEDDEPEEEPASEPDPEDDLEDDRDEDAPDGPTDPEE